MNIKDILDVICKYVCNKDNNMSNTEKAYCKDFNYYIEYRTLNDKRFKLLCAFNDNGFCSTLNKPCPHIKKVQNLTTLEKIRLSSLFTIINLTLFAFAIYGIYKFFS